MEISAGAHRSRVMKNGPEFPGDKISPALKKVTDRSVQDMIHSVTGSPSEKMVDISRLFQISIACPNRLSMIFFLFNLLP